jgi:H-type lectin domain
MSSTLTHYAKLITGTSGEGTLRGFMVEHGDVGLSAAEIDDKSKWSLSVAPEGPVQLVNRRSFSQHIQFRRQFERVPFVMLDLEYLNASVDHNLRVTVEARNVSVTGFDLYVGTWNKSTVDRVAVGWLAFAPPLSAREARR